MLSLLKAILKTMRPKQWAKNIFLFPALIFDRQLENPLALLHTLGGFVLFCLLSSTVYIINDLADVEADRQHPVKRLRPIAAGQLPAPTARLVAALLLLLIFPLAHLLSPWFMAIALVYLLLNLVYSKWLKHYPVLDVVLLALFYVIRVAAGVALITVARFSPWLYIFTFFLALFLGTGKRRAELTLLAENANAHRRVLQGYNLAFIDQMITIVTTLAIITYSLYTFSAPNLPSNHAMMLTIPFVIYGIFRYLYLLQFKSSGGAPEEVIFSDRPLQITLLLTGLTVLAIFYLFPNIPQDCIPTPLTPCTP